jgi:hypothetical protein
MKKLIFATLAFALLVPAVSLAQDAAQAPTASASATQAKQNPKAPSMVTGCLQKGDQPGEITLTAADGKIYDLRSDTVKFDEHVGHQVTATGTVTHQTAKAEEKKDGQVENAASKEAYGDLNVTDVKMVSDTCTK